MTAPQLEKDFHGDTRAEELRARTLETGKWGGVGVGARVAESWEQQVCLPERPRAGAAPLVDGVKWPEPCHFGNALGVISLEKGCGDSR